MQEIIVRIVFDIDEDVAARNLFSYSPWQIPKSTRTFTDRPPETMAALSLLMTDNPKNFSNLEYAAMRLEIQQKICYFTKPNS
ncbi:MAG: hypothetical protein H6R01_33 [Burkholderiaceae bacterium]|nr:hypothetical protein [Burkholderiaceae bacterium]